MTWRNILIISIALELIMCNWQCDPSVGSDTLFFELKMSRNITVLAPLRPPYNFSEAHASEWFIVEITMQSHNTICKQDNWHCIDESRRIRSGLTLGLQSFCDVSLSWPLSNKKNPSVLLSASHSSFPSEQCLTNVLAYSNSSVCV